MEAGGSVTKRSYDFSQFTFGSTGELVSFADWLLKIVGEQASEKAACQVATRRGFGLYHEEESMPLEEFRARASEFQIPDHGRQLIGDPSLVLSFDVTTPSGLLAELTHAGNGHQKVDISGSERPLVERVRQRIEENRKSLVAEAAEKLNAEAAERAAAEAEAEAEARRWRNRLRRAWREQRRSVTATSAAKWAAGIAGGIIVAVASGLILFEVFGVPPP